MVSLDFKSVISSNDDSSKSFVRIRVEVHMNNHEQPINPDAWRHMGNVLVLQKWARQLKLLCDGVHDEDNWAMAGRFVMLVHPYKSSQIKLLKLVAEEAGFDFIEEDGESFMHKVLSGEEFSVKGPSLVYVPQGAWSAVDAQEGISSKDLAQFRRKLGGYLTQVTSSKQVVFATSGQSYNDISSELRTAGSIDRRFLIPRPSFNDVGNAFIDRIGRDKCDDSLLDNPDRVGVLLSVEFDDDRRQGLVALGMQRIAHGESRKLTYDDLVHFGARGSGEIDLVPEQDEEMLRRVAIHEAGHAIVAYLDSDGVNVPEYISVLPGHHFRGISVDSYAYVGGVYENSTYEDSRHKIRVLLAGRAAESLILGRTKVGATGSSSDLINASSMALELMGSCGFSHEIDFVDCPSRNLLVVDEEPSQVEQARIEKMARKYLAYQFKKVEGILGVGAGPLMMLSDKLVKKQVILQREFRDILTYNN